MPRISTYLPSTAIFGLPYSMGTFVEDVKRFGRMMRGTLGPSLQNAKADATLEDFLRLEALGLAGTPLAVDIETAAEHPDEPWTGKDPTRARLKTIAFGTESEGISCMWETAGSDIHAVVARMLNSPIILKVFQNGPWFDMRVLVRYGMPTVNWEDTRDLRRALSSTSKLSLGYLGSLYCDIEPWKVEEESGDDSKGLYATSDTYKLQVYNAKDSMVTARVWAREQIDITPDDADRVGRLYQMHKELSQICARMHTKGIWVHQEWRGFIRAFLEQSIEEKKAELRGLIGMPDFPCTDHSMRAHLFKRHKKPGIPCLELPDPYSKKLWTSEMMDTISVDYDSLLALLVGGAIPEGSRRTIEVWWDLQSERKRYGYIKSVGFDQAIGRDGRLRPGWNSCGTDTGRFSCSEPNVMNIEQILRHILAPPPGRAIVHADKAQLEIRVMGCVAQDLVLWDAIASGDLYSSEACDYFGLDPATFDVKKNKAHKAARQSAKIIRLARQYGAGLQTCYGQALAMDRSFTLQRTKVLMEKFDSRYYRTVQYWHEEGQRVKECGYSESRLLGRRRVYSRPPGLSDWSNYPIQSTASDIMNQEIIELDSRLAEVRGADIIMQLHDAVDVECDEKDVPKVEQIMSDVMNRDWTICGLTKPFPVEIKTTYGTDGGTWADV